VLNSAFALPPDWDSNVSDSVGQLPSLSSSPKIQATLKRSPSLSPSPKIQATPEQSPDDARFQAAFEKWMTQQGKDIVEAAVKEAVKEMLEKVMQAL
jgi:hypothetical protein